MQDILKDSFVWHEGNGNATHCLVQDYSLLHNPEQVFAYYYIADNIHPVKRYILGPEDIDWSWPDRALEMITYPVDLSMEKYQEIRASEYKFREMSERFVFDTKPSSPGVERKIEPNLECFLVDEIKAAIQLGTNRDWLYKPVEKFKSLSEHIFGSK